MIPLGIDLAQWRPIHGASVRQDGDDLIITDGTTYDWHLLRVTDPRLAGIIVLDFVAYPLPGCDTELYVNHWGGYDICRIHPNGMILDQALARKIDTSRQPDGGLRVAVEFYNSHETVSFGTSQGPGGRYPGLGFDQYRLRDITISLAPQDDAMPGFPLTLVDVGAMGGLQQEWLRYRDRIEAVVVEPNPIAAAALRQNYPNLQVVEAALFNRRTRRPLYVTRHPGCTSLLRPNRSVLDRYALAPIFDVTSVIDVDCVRYDELHAAGLAPRPDILKIDVQGVELEVLEGFGELLHQCLAVEAEVHFYPIYTGQKLAGDIIAYLDQFNLSLRTIQEQRNFDGNAVEFNAFFTRRDDGTLKARLAFIDQVWNLNVSGFGANMAEASLRANASPKIM